MDLRVARSLLEHPCAHGLVVLDRDGKVLDANAAARAWSVPTLEAAAAQALADARASLERHPERALAIELRLEAQPQPAQLRAVTGADGTFAGYTLSFAEPHGAGSGEVPEHQRWRHALEHAEDGLWDWRADTGKVFRSARCLSMLGYGEGDIPETVDAWHPLVHPDDRQRQRDAIRNHLEGRSRSYHVEYRARHRDGRWIWILDRGKVLTWAPDGRPARVIGMHTDITAYKELETQLVEQELILGEAQRIGRVGSWAWNPSEDRVWWSEQLHRLAGWPLDQPAPSFEQQRALWPPEAYERLRQAVARALAQGEGYAMELELRRPDGELLQVQVTGDIVPTAGGGMRLVGVVRDITEEKRAHATARWHNDLLNRMAAMGRIGGLELDLATDRMQWTDENYRIHGMEPGTPLTVEALLPRYRPDSARRLREGLERLRSGATREEALDVEFEGDDGRLRVLRVTATAETADGRPFRITGLTQDITAEREASERIEQLAHYDLLTSLPNRFLFQMRGSEAVRTALHEGQSLALLFVDLDRFKNVNDTLGHAAGDALLRDAAARIRGCVRTGDLVGRLGGDEFVVLLRELKRPEDSGLVAEKIIAAVGDPFALPGGDVQVGASVGIALLGEANLDLDTLMRASDTAMYAAKDAGRNTFCFYSDAFYERVQRRVRIEHELRQALARDELRLVYQPTLRLGAGNGVGGIEALLRWRPADGEERSPMEFIPIAEDTGAIVPIGRWVLLQACAQARAWSDAGLAFERIAVNVSAVQLREPAFAEHVVEACAASGWPAARLELELTESALMHDDAPLRRTFEALARAGIRLSVDDFGTGFSNLHYLHRFPVRHLKIDRSFVRQMLTDPQVAILAHAIVDLGHGLGLRVVAEGVEEDAQLALLRGYGCDEAQGFLFARPLAPDALEAWIRERTQVPDAARDPVPR